MGRSRVPGATPRTLSPLPPRPAPRTASPAASPAALTPNANYPSDPPSPESELRVSIQQRMIGGSASLLARSRQNPPLFVVAGVEANGTTVIKTWIGSKLAMPAHVIDVAQQLKVGQSVCSLQSARPGGE